MVFFWKTMCKAGKGISEIIRRLLSYALRICPPLMPPLGCPADIFVATFYVFNGGYMINLVVPLIMYFIFSQQLFCLFFCSF